MAKIQLGTGSSSASSHRITQSSQTLNRRYVGRPSNLIIDEAAQSAAYDEQSTASTPSRLVNLRVHAADLQQLQQPEPAQPTITPEPHQVVPKVVELGSIDREMVADNIGMGLTQVVPPEEPIEQAPYSTPVSQEMALMPAASFSAMAPTSEYNSASTAEYINSTMMPVASYPDASTMMPAPTEVDTQALAMNIAADYAAASFGASMNDMNGAAVSSGMGMVATSDSSIDVIAQAASEAIAAIRVATDPAEVAEQVASLQAFAANIKATSTTPEMLELSDTIEKFVDIAMKSTKVQEEVEKRSAKKSESIKLNTKPAAGRAATSDKAAPRTNTLPKTTARPVANARKVVAPKVRPMGRRATKTAAPKLVADEDQALRKALRSVAAMDEEVAPSAKISRRRMPTKAKTGRKRFALAFICATACVAAVVYFVGTNIPDISVKVAAMQTGIEAKYPAYVPRDFSLSDINSENGKITLTFKGPNKASFTLSEEKSSWDSTALLRNYVEPTWQDNYTTTHEQGITVYIAGANAAWVNGGVLYKISTPGGSNLTNKQLRNIVTSL